ncbi:MAG: putative Ig domain, partial [Rhodobacteraceae bacterium HLUCCA12]
MAWSLVMTFFAALSALAIVALTKRFHTGPAAPRWRQRALAVAPCLLLALPASAQSVSFSGVSPSTFSSVGETLTVSFRVSSGNYYDIYELEISGWTFSNISCPTIPGQSTVTCTAEYTTTNAMDVIFAGGSYTLLRENGSSVGGGIDGSVTATYEPSTALDLALSDTSVSLTRDTAMTAITANATGGDGDYTFSVSPALPAGLGIDADSGEIAGTPTEASAT